jgi:hypothetical protein
MLAEQFNKKRYDAGRADMLKEWEAWNERRQEAEAKGQTFDEPPPKLEKPE